MQQSYVILAFSSRTAFDAMIGTVFAKCKINTINVRSAGPIYFIL